jgi:hypothetical protein
MMVTCISVLTSIKSPRHSIQLVSIGSPNVADWSFSFAFLSIRKGT